MPSELNKTFNCGDAFLLGYLPYLIGAHFQALEILIQTRASATGELSARVEARLRALQERGPEVVSGVWKIESIFGDKLHVQPTAPPQSYDDVLALRRAIEVALNGAPNLSVAEYRTAYALGLRCGAAETLVATTALRWALWAAAPVDAQLGEGGHAARESLKRFATSTGVTSSDPTMRSEDAGITHAMNAAVAVAARTPDDAAASELAKIQAQLGNCARSLESATLGTPRASVRGWSEKQLSGGDLLRRLAEHQRWSVPSRIGPDGKPQPHVLQFDKRVLFAFSDSQALAERPALLQNEKPEEPSYYTYRGTDLFLRLPDLNVDVIVLDPTNDQNAPLTINYPREMFSRLRQSAEEVALELAACDWSWLDLAALRAYSFWILVGAGSVHNLMAPDGYGRPRVSMFSTEAALEAHLARATPEQASVLANQQRMLAPGKVLFPSIAQLDVAGIILNPSGPGRTRAFNKRTVEKLAVA